MNAIEQEEQELINKLNEIKIKKQIYEQINKKIYDTPPLDLKKLMEYQLFSV